MNKYATTPQGQYHGPLPVRNFFPLPNIIFDLGLTAEEIAVYAFLMKCEDRRTYTCYPSYKTKPSGTPSAKAGTRSSNM